MTNLILKQGLYKKAGADGPTFEQQFGILTNAAIVEKFPQLDACRIAFQVLEKSDDNDEGSGVAIYLLGSNVIYVPSFFRGGKINTGDIMYVAKKEQLLPLSDAWMADVRESNYSDAGTQMDPGLVNAKDGSPQSVTIRDLLDPITKSAVAHFNSCAGFDDPDAKEINLLDLTLRMGKKASEKFMDTVLGDVAFMNSVLKFYDGNQVHAFAKKAAEMFKEAAAQPVAEMILPLEDGAKSLSDKEMQALYRDGFFIRKTAAAPEHTPTVIKAKELPDSFRSITRPGKVRLPSPTGDISDCLVFVKNDMSSVFEGNMCCDCCGGDSENAVWALNAEKAMFPRGRIHFIGIKDGNMPFELESDTLSIGTPEPMSDADIKGIGVALDPDKQRSLPRNTVVILPGGAAIRFDRYDPYVTDQDDCGWVHSYDGSKQIRISSNPDQKTVIVTESLVQLPMGCRVILPKGFTEEGLRIPTKDEGPQNPDSLTHVGLITLATLPAFIALYRNKNYDAIKITTNGSEFAISGAKESSGSLKEASFALVTDYNVDPAVAKILLKEASNGASFSRPRCSEYLLTKVAENLDDPWRDSPVGMTLKQETRPEVTQMVPPTGPSNPEALMTAVQQAADQGIKDVFDVTVLKMLAQQTDVFDDIADDLPDFMNTIDKLCRRLFQFYAHMDDMEEQYGMVKMKTLEQAIKNSLDSLSELTIFFKTRSVLQETEAKEIGSGLMSGNML